MSLKRYISDVISEVFHRMQLVNRLNRPSKHISTEEISEADLVKMALVHVEGASHDSCEDGDVSSNLPSKM